MQNRKVLVPVVLLAVIALLGLTLTPSSPKAFAQSNCPSGQFCVFIPSVFQRPNGPQLLSPTQGEALTILAPVFKWTTPIPGRYRIQVSEEATFNSALVPLDLDTTVRVRDATQQQAQRIANSNVDARKTYYWRVGIEEPLDSGNYAFSSTQSFTTPQRKDSTLVAAVPTLRTPANGVSLRFTTTDVTLVWDPVPGAIAYRVKLDIGDGTRVDSELVTNGTNSVTFVGVGAKGTNYLWEVKAANSYGWSDFSAPFRFRIQAN